MVRDIVGALFAGEGGGTSMVKTLAAGMKKDESKRHHQISFHSFKRRAEEFRHKQHDIAAADAAWRTGESGAGGTETKGDAPTSTTVEAESKKGAGLRNRKPAKNRESNLGAKMMRDAKKKKDNHAGYDDGSQTRGQ